MFMIPDFIVGREKAARSAHWVKELQQYLMKRFVIS